MLYSLQIRTLQGVFWCSMLIHNLRTADASTHRKISISIYLMVSNRPTRYRFFSIYILSCPIFTPCIECRLVRRKLSVRPSVCPSIRLSNACIVTNGKKDLCRFFLYHTKYHLASFSEKKNGW